ncbi:hypothetical protein SmJEL517_g03776 [Synchytrium microbalum]|uniref:Bromo domain-containing protein n=1 Tax=Synchytrium microbalum TaxID=1806994 RepID=A0A507C5E4_9FUNG|nr:uncharacterized protein SmJEL517_g03776 [Synchytrium microbalum]TPX33324.1 hypothetical protein SmJEL517_g03776 [Synchytrium microbalum]
MDASDKKGWTTTECLILAQSVYQQAGNDKWAAVSKQLKAHSCTSKPPDYFTPSACSTQFTALAALDQSANEAEGEIAARLARRFHIERITELKAELAKDDETFRQLVQEILDIRDGKLDEKLTKEMEERKAAERTSSSDGKHVDTQVNDTKRESDSKTTAMEVDSPTREVETKDAKKEDEVMTDGYTSGIESVDGSTSRPRKGSISSTTKEDPQKRNFRKICMAVWDKIADHRFGNVFKANRDDQLPGYSDDIKRPMSLMTIKQRIREGEITSPDELHRDLLLMLVNIIMYNKEGSDVYDMALEFKKFIDAELSQLRITYQRART